MNPVPTTPTDQPSETEAVSGMAKLDKFSADLTEFNDALERWIDRFWIDAGTMAVAFTEWARAAAPYIARLCADLSEHIDALLVDMREDEPPPAAP